MAAKKTSKKKALPDIKFVSKDVPIPEGDAEHHLFKVTLVVLADSRSTPDQVLQHVMSGCLRHPVSLPVVNGYGAGVKNLTLTGNSKNRRSHQHSGSVYCTGFENVPVPKNGKVVPVIQVAE